ncbi:MAG: response regulator transcription factor [Plesiomonas sp.]
MKVLVVEDEQTLAAQIAEALTEHQWTVEQSHDGIDALYRATSETWDAIVLDLGLPKLDGLTVLRSLRSEGIHTPIIILSARTELHQRIDGLNAGADDYLTKPFQMAELVARLSVQRRRAAGHAASVLQIGALTLNTQTAGVTWQGKTVDLTSLEYKVLAYLMHNQGKVVSRTDLVERIYQQDFDRDSNTIEVFIGRIRRKIDSQIIQTVRGLGYRINDQ